MIKSELKIEQVQWKEYEQALRRIRRRVFIQEQNVPEVMEWEAEDADCIHLLASYHGKYIATARLLETGQIGRMAVLKPWRCQGVGGKMLVCLLSIAQDNKLHEVFLNAQLPAINFYTRYGFITRGEIFDDAGIPHRRMTRSLEV